MTKALAPMTPPGGLPALREAYVLGKLGLPTAPKSPRTRTLTIDGPAGPIGLRILVPDEVRDVYLHIRGGGWIVGTNDTWDEQLEYFGTSWLSNGGVSAGSKPRLWADVNLAGERQSFPLGSAEAGGELCISRGSIAKTIAIAIPSVWSEMCVARADRSSEALRKGDAVADLDDQSTRMRCRL